MELLTALSSLTIRSPITRRTFARSAKSGSPVPCGIRRRHKLVSGPDALLRNPGGAGRPRHRALLSRPNKQKRGPFGTAHCLNGRRPTDLCATALFSFQGTDASAKPFSDRIFDRTGEARRQSQRGIDYHRVSTMSTLRGVVLSTSPSTRDSTGFSTAFCTSNSAERPAVSPPYKARGLAAGASPFRPRGRRRREPRSSARSTCPG